MNIMSYNKYIESITGSKSMEYMKQAEILQKKGKKIIDLTGGEPDFDTPKAIVDEAIKQLISGETHYAIGAGIVELREKISKYEFDKNEIKSTPNNILLVPGAKFGIYIAIASLINPGDEVIILAPMWVSYAPIVNALGGVPVIYHLKQENNYIIESNQINSLISGKTKLIIINYPNNPTGNILSQAESDILLDIIRQNDIYILSDEIYNSIIYDGSKSVSMGAYNNITKNIITVNGFSKSAAMTGWRIGYVIANEEILNVMYKLYSHSITGISPFIQKAALKYFECYHEIEEMRKTYDKRRNFFVDSLNSIKCLSCTKPKGAFYAWVNFDVNMSEHDLCDLILEKTGVLGVPGSAYGELEKKCIRFSFACDMKRLEEAVIRLTKLFNTL